MARRNLRKWAEAKERRAQQYAPPRGRWSYGPGGYGTPIFIEDPPLSTYVAPTAWLPMDPEPLFPGAIGEVLRELFHPEPSPGPPFTHTFSLPPTEYDEDGEPLAPRIEPTMTITRIVQNEALAKAYDTVGRLMLYGPDLHPLLYDHDIDRCLPKGVSL